MKLLSAKELGATFQRLDRAALEKDHGITAEIMKTSETLIAAQSTLNTNLSRLNKKSEFGTSKLSIMI